MQSWSAKGTLVVHGWVAREKVLVGPRMRACGRWSREIIHGKKARKQALRRGLAPVVRPVLGDGLELLLG